VRRLDFEDGKYSLVMDDENYRLVGLRYGEAWQEFIGNKFMGILFEELWERRGQDERV